ncbi:MULTISPECIES: hypothetical protein [unclassified Nostoc]|nr:MULTISPECIES: hypothetical protein [unclassified Nostoc]NEU78602.1 hypothetical protein [Nostoc sp. UIC 10630]
MNSALILLAMFPVGLSAIDSVYVPLASTITPAALKVLSDLNSPKDNR